MARLDTLIGATERARQRAGENDTKQLKTKYKFCKSWTVLLANFFQKNNNTFGIYNKIVVIKVYKLYRLAVLIVSKKARIFYADAEALYPLGLSCRHHQEGYQKCI